MRGLPEGLSRYLIRVLSMVRDDTPGVLKPSGLELTSSMVNGIDSVLLVCPLRVRNKFWLIIPVIDAAPDRIL